MFSFLTKEFSDAILKLDLIWNKNRGMNMIRNILEYLEKTAKRLPDKIAFSGAEGTITFAELEETAFPKTLQHLQLPRSKNPHRDTSEF